MEHKAEINRFAIFLFCLLVPLGSLAPTETSESKVTAGQRQKRFTTDIQPSLAVIQDKAHELFAFYQNCVSASFHPKLPTIRSEARDRAERIPECPAFHANCCVLHHFHDVLKTLRSGIESICNGTSTALEANIKQLDTTLSAGSTFYTCRVREPPRGHALGTAESKIYIWWVLKRYKDIVQRAVELYEGQDEKKTTL